MAESDESGDAGHNSGGADRALPVAPDQAPFYSRLNALFIKGVLALLLAVLSAGAWYGWENFDDLIDAQTSDKAMQARVAISVGSPTVHTRERLLNDRFEQVSWLERELELTNPAPSTATRSDAPSKPLNETEKREPPAASAKSGAAATSTLSTSIRFGADDPRQLFEMVNGFRDVLRSERARAMLDDRHDMDDNTLDLLSFDATVMPRGNARGYAAIEVFLTPDPAELLGGRAANKDAADRLEEYRFKDLFDTYISWLEKVRLRLQSDLATLTQTLDQIDVSDDRSDYQSTLRLTACAEVLGLLNFSSEAARSKCLTTLNPRTHRLLPGERRIQADEQAARAMWNIDYIVNAYRYLPVTYRAKSYLDSISRSDLEPWRLAVQKLLIQSQSDPDLGPIRDQLRQAAASASNLLLKDTDLVQSCRERQSTLPPAPSTSPSVTVIVIPQWLLNAAARNLNSDNLTYPRFQCAGQERKNSVLRVLIDLIYKLRALQPISPPTEQSISDIFRLPMSEVGAVPTSCLAAELQWENIIVASAIRARNHGASLTKFFDIRVDHFANGCFLTVEPLIWSLREDGAHPETPPNGEKVRLEDFGKLLEGPGYSDQPDRAATRAYGYSLSPRLRQNVEVKVGQSDKLAVGRSDTSIGFGRDQALDFRGVQPEVVGFVPSEPSVKVRGARFGWLLSPRPGKELTWSVPLEQAQLGAVVTLPSWWRSALLQTCVRFVPQNKIARVMDPKRWNQKQCRVEVIRLPGSSADVSRRLGMDVLTTPYKENWKVPPIVRAGERGEPTHLLITGERLWRNTVVTLGGQKADRIEVLPDMVGIVATFRCLRRPTTAPSDAIPFTQNDPTSQEPSQAGVALPSFSARTPPELPLPATPQAPGEIAYSVPVVVWTSEGHTADQFVTVITGTSDPPCPILPPEPMPPAAQKTTSSEKAPPR